MIPPPRLQLQAMLDFHSNTDRDPAPHQSDTNLRSLI
jgi:hypothetical protein